LKVFGEYGAAYIANELVSRGVSLEFVQDEGMVVIDDLFPGISKPVAAYVSSLHFKAGLKITAAQQTMTGQKCLLKMSLFCLMPSNVIADVLN
jgi:hypothetical protein